MATAIYVTTNGYDAVLLPNGSWVEVDTGTMNDFANEPGDFVDWNGPNRWDDIIDDMEIAAKDMGEVIAYYDDNRLVIVNTSEFEARKEFYLGN